MSEYLIILTTHRYRDVLRDAGISSSFQRRKGRLREDSYLPKVTQQVNSWVEI